MIEILGQSYTAVVGSDVDRDGMYLELSDSANVVIAEVFYSDESSRGKSRSPRERASSAAIRSVQSIIARNRPILIAPQSGVNIVYKNDWPMSAIGSFAASPLLSQKLG